MTGRHTQTLPERYFVEIYASDPDPWRFTSSEYERAKYAAILEALPRACYARALEVGCSIGVFTHALAPRCADLTALDVAPAALAAAAERCADRPQVRFVQGAVPEAWPPGRFDLIVFGEMLYFLDRPDLARLVAHVEGSLEPGGDCVLVHWLGETDYPQSGDEASEGFIAEAAGFCRPIHRARTGQYRLDILRAQGGPADAAG